jgi:Asp-tRNA(Asn)/Glu-tRNA(Gln) amidotransferase A subunit family amidase
MAAALADFAAWVMPSTGSAAPPLDSTGDPRFNSPWSYVGVPAVTLPCDLAASNGTGIGLQLIGPAHSDAQVLDIAQWCERQIGFAAIVPRGTGDDE